MSSVRNTELKFLQGSRILLYGCAGHWLVSVRQSLPLLGMGRLKHFPFVLMWQYIVLAACRISSAEQAAEEFTSVFNFMVLQHSGRGVERREGHYVFGVSAEAHCVVHNLVRRNMTCFAF